MMTMIGLCAGEIWRYLDSHGGEASLQDLFSVINSSSDIILMAAGWLGREGYVLIEGELPNPRLKLNPKPPAKR